MERVDRRRRILASLLLLLVFHGGACAHTREVLYPNGDAGLVSVKTDRGVRVRAPFVDVQVQGRDADVVPDPVD